MNAIADSRSSKENKGRLSRRLFRFDSAIRKIEPGNRAERNRRCLRVVFDQGGDAMYCPRCGHEPNESLRFCSRCGFQLDEVKNILVSKPEAEPGAKMLPLRQFDINLGAGLTLVGALKAYFLPSLLSARSAEESLIGLYFLAAGFAIFLLVCHLSPRQRGLSLGATLMFLGSMVAASAASFFGIAGLLTVAAILIPLILFWLPLLRGASRFFLEKEAPLLIQKEQPGALPPASQSINTTRRPITSEVVPAPSVTENTTSLLEED